MLRRQSGFTLVEIAIIVTVIAILASITIVTFVNVQRSTRDDTRINQTKTVMAALQQYFNENGEYPNACGSLNIECPLASLSSSLTPNLIPSIPVGPPDQNGRTLKYIRGTATNSYAIFVPIETGPTSNGAPCKAGKNMDMNWWGGATATPKCSFSSS